MFEKAILVFLQKTKQIVNIIVSLFIIVGLLCTVSQIQSLFYHFVQSSIKSIIYINKHVTYFTHFYNFTVKIIGDIIM